ncbi:DUF1365 domain-containing protein [Pseudorhodoferax sp. Leaf267]|uniref:DUF1365 domain-containing protein n=1 Tax=Pseudorhodoferax sp. Leaf267 TaxID=1736316 RepID=UPI0006FC3F82|nr:DUF1365 family protein [Pseudorhodoferax sp. Leaf267]KQP18351.1 hypothetical protein ASF43_11100 [Pseudorhodoferax sp. Leaf267]
MNSALYTGTVMHQRLRPLRHRLRYRVFSLLVDLDELPALAKRLRLLSVDRFNLFSIHLRDHGAGEAAGPRAHVERQLRAAGLPTGGAIRLLAMPRILGYAFNPLSVYFCHAPGGALQAILYEVNNTFGERHSYFIEVASDQDQNWIAQRCDKKMHVSPFLGLDMHYRFRIRPPGEDLSIGVQAHDTLGPMLLARFDAQRRPLGDAALLRAFCTHPLLTIKVVAAIHWEALRLWLKGARLHPHPPAPIQGVTLVAKESQTP